MPKVLIVDDNLQNRYLLQALLGGHGFETRTAENGFQALEILKGQFRAEVIISDILMPVMDGFEFCRQCKQDDQFRWIPFLFYTATYTEREDEQFAHSIGAERFLTKPQSPDVILATVHEMLETLPGLEQITPKSSTLSAEMEFFRKHNSILFKKLDEKIAELEREVAERRQTEELLRKRESDLLQSQKMESIGLLTGGIAHDFNNILSSIMLNAEFLGDMLLDQSPCPKCQEPIRQISEAARRAANLTRQLLTFTRREPLTRRPMNLNEVVGHLMGMLHRILGEHVSLAFSACPDVLVVQGDVGMLEQVVMNLTINARDAIAGGGSISIQTSSAAFSALEAQGRGVKEGEYACILIRDSGIGMDEHTLKQIFDPFFTTKEAGKGTGLGLATSRSVIQQHGGWIEVESAPGQGTLFTVFLPRLGADVLPEPRISVPLPTRGGTETLLMVEDDEALRKTLGGYLTGLGYRVLEAVDCVDALHLWDQHSTDIQLLLTDAILPGGLTGWQLTQQLRMERPDLKVITMSGYYDERLCADKLEEGVNYLPKPFMPGDLARALRRSLD